MKLKITIVTSIILFAMGLPAFAHHGNAEFDLTQSVSLKATIADFVWSNPHSVIFFDVRGDNGKVTRWGCETVQPALLSSRRLDKRLLEARRSGYRGAAPGEKRQASGLSAKGDPRQR